MLEKERETLKSNAVALAGLLTENVPYLLGHYLKNGVLTEAEREDIIQADSSEAIRIQLVTTLASKEGVSLTDVIEGLNATDNQHVSKEIQNLLSELKTGEEVADNGSGDKPEDLSAYATNLVDEVIAKAEKTTAEREDELEATDEVTAKVSLEEFLEETKEQEQPVIPDQVVESGITANNKGDESDDQYEKDEEGKPTEEIADKLVETSVEVHTTKDETDAGEQENSEEYVGVDDTVQPSITTDVNEDYVEDKEESERDVPDRSVKFQENVATIIEDEKHYERGSEDDLSSSATPTTTEDHFNHKSEQQNESENEEDVDDIDIEKEFVMPPEAERSVNNNNLLSNGKLSNDIILDNESKDDEEKEGKLDNGKNSDQDDELAAVLARKALVRQQVEMFEKKSPGGPGKVKYSFRAASQDKEQSQTADESGSKVKNLKNFFQRLSTNDNTTSSPPSGAVKPVGKLKVTFPASS